jgi:multimeric flavodoxin WrbA
MKVLVLHGSPRKGGDSDTLVGRLLDGLRESECPEVVEYYANELDIKPCQGCLACNRPPAYACAIQDDMQAITRDFAEANLVIFSTPMYWGYMTAQLKTVVDRMEAIAHERYFKGKVIVLVATYRHHVESTVAFFCRVFPFFGADVEVLTYRSYDPETDRDLPASGAPEKLEEAFELGKSLAHRG